MSVFNRSAYNYTLPEELIAQYPLAKRDEARLMIIDRAGQSITHDIFAKVGKYLPSPSLMVINNSKVIPLIHRQGYHKSCPLTPALRFSMHRPFEHLHHHPAHMIQPQPCAVTASLGRRWHLEQLL